MKPWFTTTGLDTQSALVGIAWAISLLLCMNGLRKQSAGLTETPLLAIKLFWSVLTCVQDGCKGQESDV